MEEKEIKKSKTDPESGFLTREGKPKGFFYHDHRSVDNRYNLITDVHITPGNVHDSIPYLNRLDYQLKRYAFPVQAVGIDAGYNTSAICKGIIERNIFGVIGQRGQKRLF